MADEPEAVAPETVDTPAQPEEINGCPVGYSRGQRVLHVPRERLREVVRGLTADGYIQCIDVTAVDYLDYPAPRDLPEGVAPERYELVVILMNHRQAQRLRLRVQVPAEDPRVDSLFELHPGAEALEREVFDMFGIAFEGHPDLTRILMPEDWQGHPLRKDYSVGRIPVQFKGAPSR